MPYARNKVLSFMTKYKNLIQKQPNLSLVFLVFHCSYVSKMVKSLWNFFYWKGLWECFLSHFLILWLIISFYAYSKTPSYDSNSFFHDGYQLSRMCIFLCAWVWGMRYFAQKNVKGPGIQLLYLWRRVVYGNRKELSN